MHTRTYGPVPSWATLRLTLLPLVAAFLFVLPAVADAAIAHRASTQTALTTAGTSVTVAKPAGTVAGDVLVASVLQNGTSTGSVTLPAGFVLNTSSLVATVAHYRAYDKAATASEPSSYTFTFSNSSKHIVSLSAYSGAEVVNATSQKNTSQQVCPSQTASAGQVLICAGASLNGDLHTYPASMAERVDARTGSTLSDRSLASGDEQITASGATGTRTVTLTTPEDNVGASILLSSTTVTPPPPPPAKAVCEDGLDNDSDGKIDFPADPGCSSATDTDETDAPPPPPPPSGCGSGKTLLKTLDYETGSFSQWSGGTQSEGGGSSSIVTSPVRQGTYAAKFNLPSGSGRRAEVYDSTAGSTKQVAGETRTYCFSKRPGLMYQTESRDGPHEEVIQWKGEGTGGGPVNLQIQAGVYGVDPGIGTGITRMTACPLNPGQWTDFEVTIKTSLSATGSVLVKCNGNLGLSRTGIQTMNTGTTFNYLKEGIYGGTTTAAREVHADGMKVYRDATTTTTAGGELWLSATEIAALPMTGAAWDKVNAAANSTWPAPAVSDCTNDHDVYTLAGALVAQRTGSAAMKTKTVNAIMAAIGTENGSLNCGSRGLGVGRNMSSYPIAADIVGLTGTDETNFRNWITTVQATVFAQASGSRTMKAQCAFTASNHGTMQCASSTSIAAYLGDTATINANHAVFLGYLGDRTSHLFTNGDDTDPAITGYLPDNGDTAFRPINRVGATRGGNNIDGLPPVENVRCGNYTWPPCYSDYIWGGLQGAQVNAELLYRAGKTDVYTSQTSALRRYMDYIARQRTLQGETWWARASTGDASWQPYLMNFAYGSTFQQGTDNGPGQNMGWGAWTHNRSR